jgi:hypothetical protein
MKNEKQQESIQEIFMNADFIDYVSIEMIIPSQSETTGRDELRLGLQTLLKGKKKRDVIDHMGVLSIATDRNNKKRTLEDIYSYMAIVYEAYGFEGPADGAEIFADSLNGEIIAVRWTIAKSDRKLSVKNLYDITEFKFGNADRNKYKLLHFDYGSQDVREIGITSGNLRKLKSTVVIH